MPSATSSLKSMLQLHDPIDPTARLTGTRIVVAAFAGPEAFLEAYSDDGPAGALLLATRAQPRGRAELVLEVVWPGLPNPVCLRAQVTRRRLGLSARLHADEAVRRDFLLRVARGGGLELHRRRHRRYCVRFALGWRRFGSTTLVDGVAHDLSAGGMLVMTTATPPPVGEPIGLRLRTSGLDIVVTGVARHRRERQHGFAFGVQFQSRGSGEQKVLRRLLRAFAARGVVILDGE